ncbi:MAG: gliding motility lipoprotein GldD [Bacteroidales bacterium]|jgi:gliding motility-associated lipoprotein GldD|nr:gliding motility lipoprotein GldD [Bacteroidales bacterium]NLM93149.1 gliding motility lipoprotein GldD [Bacteroidales bacterium]
MKKILLILSVLFLFACQGNYSPKPRGFFRIDLPEKEYVLFDSIFPYAFEYPSYGEFVPDRRTSSEPYWGNLEFPQFKGTVHLSYKEVENEGDLVQYFEDARSFAQKHIPKATAISEELLIDDRRKVYGVLYEIKGNEAASTLQFYVTDSLDHFLRGALYFSVSPNNDSLGPVIDFLEEDIRHLINTLQWK